MSYPFNYPNPTNADVKIYVGSNRSLRETYSWTKPQGCSFVWFTLIGHGGLGGAGDGAAPGLGGGSGAVTNCLMPAFLIPDSLTLTVVNPATGTTANTSINFVTKNSSYVLLEAAYGGSGSSSAVGAGGAASSRTVFGCAGLFQSVAGQNGGGATISASATTFLGGGSGAEISGSSTLTGNYGYSNVGNANTPVAGYFQIQPIIVGYGSGNGGSTTKPAAGVGCGGAGSRSSDLSSGGYGGPGMIVIISW